MLIRNAMVIVCVTLLTSCATSYKPPTGTSTAKLLVYAPQTKTFASVQIVGYASNECENPMSLGMIGGIVSNASDEKLNIPKPDNYKADAFVERLIPAGKRYLFSVRSFLPGKTCVITSSFVPMVDHNYEASIVWENNVCHLGFGKIEVSSEGKVKSLDEPTYRKEQTCNKGLN